MRHQHFNQRDCSTSEVFRACINESESIAQALAQARESLRQRFVRNLSGNERLLTLALNEAEALAWNTGFPHLVFPVLGEEKALERVAWNQRQQTLRKEFAFAE